MVTIFLLTLKELSRKKALLLIFILMALHLTCYALGLRYGRPSDAQMPNPIVMQAVNTQLLGFAIYTGSYISAFFSIFAASGAVAAEVESGVLHAIVPKPISRWEIMVGKFLGYALGSISFNLLLLSSIIIVSDIITGQRVISEGIVRVFSLFALMPLPLVAVTLLASVYLPAISAGVAGSMAFMMSITGGMMEQIGKMGLLGGKVIMRIGMASNLLAPIDAIYRVIYGRLVPPNFIGDMGPFGAASTPREWMVPYAAVFTVVILGLSILSFNRKDL